MSKAEQKIQRVEILTDEHAIHCPFCGAIAISAGDSEDVIQDFCEHTLFMAHDEGFEYRSARFDALMGITGLESDDIALGKGGVDSFTDQLALSEAVKFALYTPAPSFFGAYVGFAPTYAE